MCVCVWRSEDVGWPLWFCGLCVVVFATLAHTVWGVLAGVYVVRGAKTASLACGCRTQEMVGGACVLVCVCLLLRLVLSVVCDGACVCVFCVSFLWCTVIVLGGLYFFLSNVCVFVGVGVSLCVCVCVCLCTCVCLSVSVFVCTLCVCVCVCVCLCLYICVSVSVSVSVCASGCVGLRIL